MPGGCCLTRSRGPSWTASHSIRSTCLPGARGPALQTVTPLLAELEARRGGHGGLGRSDGTGPAPGPAGIAELVAGGDHALAEAAGRWSSSAT